MELCGPNPPGPGPALGAQGPVRRHRRSAARVATALAGLVVAASCLVGAVSPAAPAAAAPASHSQPVSSHNFAPSTWIETWSTGPLPDVGASIAESSPTPATLEGQPSVVAVSYTHLRA